jgi:hypothetical protein
MAALLWKAGSGTGIIEKEDINQVTPLFATTKGRYEVTGKWANPGAATRMLENGKSAQKEMKLTFTKVDDKDDDWVTNEGSDGW